MDTKSALAGVAAGVLISVGGMQLSPDSKVTLNELGPDRVWEQDYNGTDGSDPSKIYLVSVKVWPDGTKDVMRIPKTMVKD